MATEMALTDPRLKSASMAETAELLHRLFASLPQHGGADPATALQGYVIALEGLPAWAIEQTVARYLQGRVPGQDKRWAPRPPQLAEAVRAELAPVYAELGKESRKASFRGDDRPAPRSSGPAPFQIRQEQALAANAHLPVLHVNVSLDEFRSMNRNRQIPAGAKWVACLGIVYGPSAVAENSRQNDAIPEAAE